MSVDYDRQAERMTQAAETAAHGIELFAIAFDRLVTLAEGVVNDARVYLKEKGDRDAQSFRRH
jgi:hypothetical protein